MAAIPIAGLISGLGAVFGAYSSIQQGKAQSAQYKSQQQADLYNAKVQEQNAATIRQQASAREETQRRQARQILGEQRASLAQAGIGLEGSAADIYGQSAANAELDALNIRYEGELEAGGLLAQSKQSVFQSEVSGLNAKTAQRAGYTNAATGILSGATNLYGSYKSRKIKGG